MYSHPVIIFTLWPKILVILPYLILILFLSNLGTRELTVYEIFVCVCVYEIFTIVFTIVSIIGLCLFEKHRSSS